jgi:serine/threonine-protein kinase
VRNGHKAVEDATKACELTQWNDMNSVDTLAAACTGTGAFDRAVKFERQYSESKPSD